MKIVFKPKTNIVFFPHERSGSYISMEHAGQECVVSFGEEDLPARAAIVLSDLTEAEEFIALFNLIGPEDYDLDRRIHGADSTLSLSYRNYGDPFEECIEFSFVMTDSASSAFNEEVAAELNLHNVEEFCEAILNGFQGNK